LVGTYCFSISETRLTVCLSSWSFAIRKLNTSVRPDRVVGQEKAIATTLTRPLNDRSTESAAECLWPVSGPFVSDGQIPHLNPFPHPAFQRLTARVDGCAETHSRTRTHLLNLKTTRRLTVVHVPTFKVTTPVGEQLSGRLLLAWRSARCLKLVIFALG
jgi:hypothetical protein